MNSPRIHPTSRRKIRIAHLAVIDATVRHLLLPQLERLRDEGFDVTAISAPGPSVSEIESHGVRHIPWRHVTRVWDPRADIRALRELLAILRRERFDLVHTHTPKAGLIGRIAARLARVPYVVNTVHGLYATKEDPLVRRIPVLALEWLAARMSHLELYQSEEDLIWSKRRGVVSPSKGVLLGNGTDLTYFDPAAVPPERLGSLRQELGIPEGSLVVGTVGRLVREKGYAELAAAARTVSASVPDVVFLAVGPGDLGERDAISRDLIEDVLRCTGMRTDVRELLALMDVFVLATWREGVPRSAIEASAMGKAMILTDVRGCREVIRGGIDGLLVPPRDPSALSAAITRLVLEPDLRERLGTAARTRALERFDEREVEDVLVAGYRRVINGSKMGQVENSQGGPVTDDEAIAR